jgi:hypothetical protein
VPHSPSRAPPPSFLAPRARALCARRPRRVLTPSRAPPSRRSRRRLLQPAELALSTLASLVASTLHRARRHFRSPRADRANASFRPPSSRPLRSPPSPRPHSIALAATFVSLAPIASILADDSASRLPIARVFCPCRPRRASLSIARDAHCERRHLRNFAPRAQRMDRGRHRLLPGLKDFLLRILQVKFPNVRMRLLRYTFLSTISRSRLTASIFDKISHIIC